jgi:hypothetical protein
MRQGTRVRIFSLKRLLLSVVLGFLLPLSYAIILSEASDRTGKTAPEFMVSPFGWPRPLWIFLMGRQPEENDLINGIIFLALCNIVLYGAITYAVLLALSAVRHKRTVLEPPPPPEHSPTEQS